MRTSVLGFKSAAMTLVAIGDLAASLPRLARTNDVTPSPVPSEIQVPGGGFAWTLFTPPATLLSDDEKQVTTHFFSPNPAE